VRRKFQWVDPIEQHERAEAIAGEVAVFMSVKYGLKSRKQAGIVKLGTERLEVRLDVVLVHFGEMCNECFASDRKVLYRSRIRGVGISREDCLGRCHP